MVPLLTYLSIIRYGYKFGLGGRIDIRHGQFAVYLLVHQGEYDTILEWPMSFQCTLTILLPTLSGMRSITAAVNVTQASATTTNCPIIYQFAIVLDLQQLRQYCVNNTVHFKHQLMSLKTSRPIRCKILCSIIMLPL